MHPKWFSKLSAYLYDEKLSFSTIEEKVEKLRHRPIKESEACVYGFGAVVGTADDDDLFKIVGDALFLTIIIEEKKVPRNKRKRKIEERAIEKAKQLNIPRNKLPEEELKVIEESVDEEMLKKQPADERYVNFYVDNGEDRFIAMETTSAKDKERIIALLQKMFDGIEPVEVIQHKITDHLTTWIRDESLVPNEVDLGQAVKMKNLESKGKADVSGIDVDNEEVMVHINSGQSVQLLQMEYRGIFSCAIADTGAVTKIKLTSDWAKNNIEAADDESVSTALHKIWQTQVSEFRGFVQWLSESFA